MRTDGSEKKALGDLTVLVKGAGEMATGIAHRLFMSHLRRIVMTEIEKPLAVRRTVAFCEAVYEGSMAVEGVTARRIHGVEALGDTWGAGEIAVVVDPSWEAVGAVVPDIVIDAIMAKRNTGTRIDEAAFVIGVGPGFTAPEDVHCVVESNRGHDLGRIFFSGKAEPYSGIPGEMKGVSLDRVLRSPHPGVVRHARRIGDHVEEGDVVLYVNETPVKTVIGGIVRGLIREIAVGEREKVGDVDPRAAYDYCFTISDKARAIGGGVLEAIMHRFNGESK